MVETRLLTLTPTDAFFFGGEQTFGSGDKRNFFAASRYFPQQTSIVGLIRHALFEAGEQANFGRSFVVNHPNDFGWLKRLSPVFIWDRKRKSMGLPLRKNELNNGSDNRPLIATQSLDNNTQVDFDFGFYDATVVREFFPKNGLKDKLIFDNGSVDEYENVFRPVFKTGIARDRQTRTALDTMFYRQVLFRMTRAFSFGVYVTGEKDLFDILNKRNMPFGGEKVNFVLEVHDEGDFSTDHLAPYFLSDQIVLISDAYVPESIYKCCRLAIAEPLSFRNIVTPGDYSPRLDDSKKNSSANRYKSGKFTLLKRGSILIPKDNDCQNDIVRELEQATQFREIGYNHYFSNTKTHNHE